MTEREIANLRKIRMDLETAWWEASSDEGVTFLDDLIDRIDTKLNEENQK